ncbi:hypothetical protein E5Q_03234 [Mixia osmundae IAM 14324]|uniref:Uncharacterized protein n=1 Tax=Mixia osmundae (strain CBS 9802 / IAM 14324 / JCM 22182 / KY 12970) TaxID=764103 RepID=G7E154_MIXOS|nr:hypothetical protein E5Q_03234 [Mixia osmundae IAM 14324]
MQASKNASHIGLSLSSYLAPGVRSLPSAFLQNYDALTFAWDLTNSREAGLVLTESEAWPMPSGVTWRRTSELRQDLEQVTIEVIIPIEIDRTTLASNPAADAIIKTCCRAYVIINAALRYFEEGEILDREVTITCKPSYSETMCPQSWPEETICYYISSSIVISTIQGHVQA